MQTVLGIFKNLSSVELYRKYKYCFLSFENYNFSKLEHFCSICLCATTFNHFVGNTDSELNVI